MGMVARSQPIASAYFVLFGKYGDVSRYADERGVCRQWVYREAARLQESTQKQPQELERLRLRVRELEREKAAYEERLAKSVVLDADKQAEFATLGQACGTTLGDCRILLDCLIPGQALSVATLGRRTQAAGVKAGQLLAVLDAAARPQVLDAAADEIYVKAPVLMVVEQKSLCWMSGRLSAEVSGAAWAREFEALPNLAQLARDGGTGLKKGVGLVNAQRQTQKRPPVVDQGDHFHALRHGGVGLRKAQAHASRTLAEAEQAQKEMEACARQGQKQTGAAARARCAWQRAEQAMDTWQERERLWQRAKGAMELFTPSGELNSRAQAEAVLAETLSQLPASDFAKAKRQMQKPEMLNYLDRVQEALAALPFPEEVKQAVVRQEGLRRRPELLRGETSQAAALRGVLLMCAVVLSKTEEVGQQALTAVRDIG